MGKTSFLYMYIRVTKCLKRKPLLLPTRVPSSPPIAFMPTFNLAHKVSATNQRVEIFIESKAAEITNITSADISACVTPVLMGSHTARLAVSFTIVAQDLTWFLEIEHVMAIYGHVTFIVNKLAGAKCAKYRQTLAKAMIVHGSLYAKSRQVVEL